MSDENKNKQRTRASGEDSTGNYDDDEDNTVKLMITDDKNVVRHWRRR